MQHAASLQSPGGAPPPSLPQQQQQQEQAALHQLQAAYQALAAQMQQQQAEAQQQLLAAQEAARQAQLAAQQMAASQALAASALSQQAQLHAAAAVHPGQHSGRPRLAPPSLYDGRSATALDGWIRELQQQFDWYGMGSDSERIALGAAHLRGMALDWWSSLAQRPLGWDEFAAQLRSRFQPVNSAQTAREQLDTLQQGPRQSVHEYIAAFRALLVRVPDMAEADRVHRFLRGLRPATAAQLRVQGVDKLDAAISMAARVGALTEHVGVAASAQRASAAAAASSAHSAMELDSIEGLEGETTDRPEGATQQDDAPITQAQLRQLLNAMREERKGGGPGSGRSGPKSHRMRGLPRIPHLSPLQVQEYMDAGKCFGCGSKDHQSRQCPKRQVGPDGKVSWLK